MIEEPKKRLNRFERILCFMGGARLSILDQCSHEKNKFIAIGIGVVNTALLSMLTMGYAINNVTGARDNIALSTIPVAILWGLIIFGIDWGLITTMKKPDPESDEFKRLNWFRRNINPAFYFRFFIAVVIAFTIAKPLEVMIFEPYLPPYRAFIREQNMEELEKLVKRRSGEVQREIDEIQNRIDRINAESASLVEGNPRVRALQNDLDEVNSQIEALESANSTDRSEIMRLDNRRDLSANQSEVSNLERELNQEDLSQQRRNEILQEIARLNQRISQDQDFNAEIDRQANPFHRRINNRNQQLAGLRVEQQTIRENYRELIESMDIGNQMEIARLRERIETLNDQRKLLETDEGARLALLDTISGATEANTFIANLITIGQIEKFRNMEEVTEDQRQLGRKVFQIGWLITLILIVAETAPLLIKYLSPFGEYELMLENKSREARDRNRVNEDINLSIGASEVRINQSLIDRLSDAQEQLIEEAIELWKQKQNPDKMFTNEQSS